MIDLYKEIIIDHGLNPRNKYIMEDFTNFGKGFNYLCGDNFTVYVKITNNNIIEKISFEGNGCSISTASASLMTIEIEKKSTEEFLEIFNYLKNLLNNKENKINIENIKILANVKNFPSRIKCATLVWHTLQDAIEYGKKEKI